MEHTWKDEYERAAYILKDYMTATGFKMPISRASINSVRKKFMKRYDYKILSALTDDKLLSYVFYSAGDNTESLCYWIEKNAECKNYYGSIANGSAFKFGLFQKKETGVWTSGSPRKQEQLSEEDAVKRGREIVAALVRGAEIIEHAIEDEKLSSLEDYENLDDELKNSVGEQFYNWIWFHKYYSIIFQDKFSSYHTSEWQYHILHCFGIKPSEKYYARSGQISMIQNNAGMLYREFFEIAFHKFGGIKSFVKMEINKKKNKFLAEWQQRSVIGIGWKALGSLDGYTAGDGVDRSAIKDKLEEIYYPDDEKTAFYRAGEIYRFYKTDNNTVFVVMSGKKLLAFVDNIGSYFYDSHAEISHLKSGQWHLKFSDGDRLPTKNEEKNYSCSTFTDEENLIYLYQKYYHANEKSQINQLQKHELQTSKLQTNQPNQLQEHELQEVGFQIDELNELQEDEFQIDELNELRPLIFHTKIDKTEERNRIVFGAPGTGKSYSLKVDCEKMLAGTTGTYERVTFYPDYSYAQFVGTYKPIMDNDGKSIRYDFVAGPFMRVYVDALKSGRTDTPQPHLLLIEEINRAKVSSVFGDIFQLLDRDDNGVSEYEIQTSEDIRRYLAKELGGTTEEYKKIRIPDNMFIWATMNSADQGVFPMDTAFKRRWNFEYLGINEKEEQIAGIGKIQLANASEPIEWNLLRRAINDKMSSSEFKIHEDKLIGPFFLSKRFLASDKDGMILDKEKFVKAFKSKVLMYLYEDAVKQGKYRFFSGCDSSRYSSVCDAFDKIGIAIFGENFAETYYDRQITNNHTKKNK